MKNNRPDSAKSAKTRITLDSDVTSNNITQSRFSETYSNGVKLGSNKNAEFEKYVAEKDKDPKFKKLLQPTLPQIPEKVRPSAELTKLTSKPFQRKASKTDKQKPQQKTQEPLKKAQPEVKNVKKENLQSSKTFIDKSKQKLKIASKQQIEDFQSTNKKEQNNQNVDIQMKQNNGAKPKISLNGFVLNIPGKPPQVIKQEKVQQKPIQTQEMKQKRQRQKMFTQISQYVSQMEQKNVDYLPKRYDEFIERNLSNRELSIQKLNIEDFMEEPNQKDYENLFKKIKENQIALQSNQKAANNSSMSRSQHSSSINLDEIIDGSQSKKEEEAEQRDDVSVIMSSMTASDVRDRNMFLTQILKGKRLTQQQLSQIKQNDDTMVKMIKMQRNQKQDQDQDDVEMIEINMNKKKSNKFMERNKIQAVGDLFRECDYLTPQQRQRIDDIINGVKIQSPFELSQMETFMRRRIDQGIKIHRQLCRSIEGLDNQSQSQIVFDQQTLPKDPNLRKKAELKILKDKINSVNQRLISLNEVVINKTKIKNLIQKYKDSVKPSKMSESLILQKRRQIDEQVQNLRTAESLLTKIENQRGQILNLVDQMIKKFGSMQEDVNRIQKMDVQERRKYQMNELKQKKDKVSKIQKQALQFEQQIEGVVQMGQQIKRKMKALDQIITINNQQIKCEGYEQGQTIEDLDALITKKWQAAEEAVKSMRDEQN